MSEETEFDFGYKPHPSASSHSHRGSSSDLLAELPTINGQFIYDMPEFISWLDNNKVRPPGRNDVWYDHKRFLKSGWRNTSGSYSDWSIIFYSAALQFQAEQQNLYTESQATESQATESPSGDELEMSKEVEISGSTLIDGVAYEDLPEGYVFNFSYTEDGEEKTGFWAKYGTNESGTSTLVEITDNSIVRSTIGADGTHLYDPDGGENYLKLKGNQKITEGLILTLYDKDENGNNLDTTYTIAQTNDKILKIPNSSYLLKNEDGTWNGKVATIPYDVLRGFDPAHTINPDGSKTVSPEDQADYEERIASLGDHAHPAGYVVRTVSTDLETLLNSPIHKLSGGSEFFNDSAFRDGHRHGSVINLQTGESMEGQEFSVFEPFGYKDRNGNINLVDGGKTTYSTEEKIGLDNGHITWDGNSINDPSVVIEFNSSGMGDYGWGLDILNNGDVKTVYRTAGDDGIEWTYDTHLQKWYHENLDLGPGWKYFSVNSDGTNATSAVETGSWMWEDQTNDGHRLFYHANSEQWIGHKSTPRERSATEEDVAAGRATEVGEVIDAGTDSNFHSIIEKGNGDFYYGEVYDINVGDSLSETPDNNPIVPDFDTLEYDDYDPNNPVVPEDSIGDPNNSPTIEDAIVTPDDTETAEAVEAARLEAERLEAEAEAERLEAELLASGDRDGDGIIDVDDPLPDQAYKDFSGYPDDFTPPEHGSEISGATSYYNPYTGDLFETEEGGWGIPEGYIEGTPEDIFDTINGYKYHESPNGDYTLISPEGDILENLGSIPVEDIPTKAEEHLQSSLSEEIALNEDWGTVNANGEQGYRMIDLSLMQPTGKILYGKEAEDAATNQALELSRMAATGPSAQSGLGEAAVYGAIDNIVGAKNNPLRWIKRFLGAESQVDAALAYQTAHQNAANATSREKNLTNYVEQGQVVGKPPLNIGGTIDEMAAPFLQQLYKTDEYGRIIYANEADVVKGLAPRVGMPITNKNYNPYYSDFMYNPGADGISGYDPGPDGKYNTDDDVWNPEAAKDDFAQMYSPNWLLPYDMKEEEASWRNAYGDAFGNLNDYYTVTDENGQTKADIARGNRKKALSESGFFNHTAGDDGIWGTEDDGQKLDANGNPIKGTYGQLADDLNTWQYGEVDTKGSRAYQDKQLLDATNYYREAGDQLENINYKQKAEDRANLYNFTADTAPMADARMDAVNNLGSIKLFGRQGVNQGNFNRNTAGNPIAPTTPVVTDPATGSIMVNAGGNDIDLMGGAGAFSTGDIGSFITSMGGTSPVKPESNMFLKENSL